MELGRRSDATECQIHVGVLFVGHGCENMVPEVLEYPLATSLPRVETVTSRSWREEGGVAVD